MEMKALGLVSKVPRLVCCPAEHANPLYRAFVRAQTQGSAMTEDDFEAVKAQTTLASAIQIGNPVSLPKAVRALAETNGVVAQASESELAEATARADRTGMFNCPHTGVALACLEKLVGDGTIQRRDRVIVVSTAHGLKFSEFKTRYHEDGLAFPSRVPNRPVEMGANPREVVEGLHRLLDQQAH